MYRISFQMEWNDFPIWIYDESGVVDVGVPSEWKTDTQLLKKLLEVQTEYNSLFVDDGKRFEALDFQSDEQRRQFCEKIQSLSNYMKYRIPPGYTFEDNASKEFCINTDRNYDKDIIDREKAILEKHGFEYKDKTTTIYSKSHTNKNHTLFYVAYFIVVIIFVVIFIGLISAQDTLEGANKYKLCFVGVIVFFAYGFIQSIISFRKRDQQLEKERAKEHQEKE